MKITPKAAKRLAKTLKPNTRGIPFIVVARGKKCYAASFWWSISSIATPEPVIMADALANTKNGAILRFQNGYPRIIKNKIPVYENKSVRNALIRNRKLTENGRSLYLKNFRSSCMYNQKIKFKNGSVLIKFRYKSPYTFTSGCKRYHALVEVVTDSARRFFLTMDNKSGKIRLIEKVANTYKRDEVLFSKTDKWASNVWYNIAFQIGNKGNKLWINGKLESQTSNNRPIKKVNKLIIGREWRSFGCFDDIEIYDMSKE